MSTYSIEFFETEVATLGAGERRVVEIRRIWNGVCRGCGHSR